MFYVILKFNFKITVNSNNRKIRLQSKRKKSQTNVPHHSSPTNNEKTEL